MSLVENYNGATNSASITPLSQMHTLTINIKEGEYLSSGGQSLYEIKDDVYMYSMNYTPISIKIVCKYPLNLKLTLSRRNGFRVDHH
jgi:hypothetical protein